MKYIKVNKYGVVTGGGSCQDEAISDIPLSDGEHLEPGVEFPGYRSIWRFSDGSLVDTGQPLLPPYPWLTWSNSSFSWVDARGLGQLKSDKWEEIKAARTNAEHGGFEWDGSIFDSDEASQQRITMAAQIATASTEFSVDWTLADNSIRTLSGADMAAVCVAMGLHVNAQHVIGRALRQQIDDAQDVEAVNQVKWPE